MGWFDEQIRLRKQSDDDVFSDAFLNIAGAVMGEKISRELKDERQITKNAYDEILKYYHIKSREIPSELKDPDDQLEYLLRPHGIMRRRVLLKDDWYHDAVGAMLGSRKEDGSPVAFLPSGLASYICVDPKTGSREKITDLNVNLFDKEAIAFYKPFPLRKLKLVDLMQYMVESVRLSDAVLLLVSTAMVVLTGMLLPKINRILFADVVTSDSVRVLLAISIFLLCAGISNQMFTVISSILTSRLNTKISASVEAASMMRMLSLPASFFRDYSSGELSARMGTIGSVCSILVSTVLSAGLMSVFSLVYIGQIFAYTPALTLPAVLVIFLLTVLFAVSVVLQTRVGRKRMAVNMKENGVSYALIAGIQKIRLSGSEKRAFAKWGNVYAEYAKQIYDPHHLIKLNAAFTIAITGFGSAILYASAIRSGVTAADYFAFQAAFGLVAGAFLNLTELVSVLSQIRPVLEMAKPILDAEPEVSEEKRIVTDLSGGIEMNNVSFRYNENMPYLMDNISLKIRPGQYVAIVGRSGCGKSTFMRLLLGFETPQKGAIYYDGKDINSLDMKSLRKKIGAVTQDGQLFQGDIFSNIVIAAPHLTMDEAWEAAETAGIAEDIREMPMGMHTILSEGGKGFSGGQKQRLMIARAIAPNPRILMFDEATSALDNITQKAISNALDELKCTRIVIAHRLSTIRHCDRILVLDSGKIAEEGTYEELIELNGIFAELVERQRTDV